MPEERRELVGVCARVLDGECGALVATPQWVESQDTGGKTPGHRLGHRSVRLSGEGVRRTEEGQVMVVESRVEERKRARVARIIY